MNKEIGGYIEFGGLINNEYHKALKFNSFRSALKFYIKAKKIKEIYLPIYLCNVIKECLIKEKIKINYYHIDKKFIPIIKNYKTKKESYVYIQNYYGLISNKELENLRKKYTNIIIDNTNDFFRKPISNTCTIYNCRKYFGVPDGAYMYCDINNNDNLEYYKITNSIKHTIGRLEENASVYYEDFRKNSDKLKNTKIYKMSKYTEIIMGAIDYKTAKIERVNNFEYLNTNLRKYNKLNINKNCNFMYPFLVNNSEKIRKHLIENKIYIPKFWPEIDENKLNEYEKEYINNIIPLPIDQRYTIKDMKKIIACLEELECIN